MKSVKTNVETKQEVRYGYNYKFQYVKAFNDYVYKYNGFNFDLFGKPEVKSNTSDKLQFLKYEVVNNIIENDEALKTVINKIIKECYKEMYRNIENKVFPLINQEIVKLPEYKVLSEIED